MTNKTVVILCVISAALAAGLTKFYFPNVKTVEVEKQVTHKDVETVTHEVKRPDGTVDTVITTTDHSSVILTDTKKEYNVVPNWQISAFALANIKLESSDYGLQAQRRILGPIFVGGMVTSRGNIGVSLGMEF